jgi:hypothetical protein
MARPQPPIFDFLPPLKKGILFFWIAQCGLSCNKSINQGSNKVYISVTNLVMGGQAVNVFYNNAQLTSLLPYDSTTAYFPVIAGIRNFKAGPPLPDSPYLNGNVGLDAGVYYSVFLYDSLNAGKAQALILQNNLQAPADTVAAFRFLNLFPPAGAPPLDSLYYIITNATDTLILGYIPFVGPEAQPSYLSGFNYQILEGAYSFGYYVDSVLIQPIDSLYFTGGKLYTLYNHPVPNGMGGDSSMTSLLQHN